MVFDRQGRFVPDLKLEQFDLQVDGKRQPIAFCELVNSGSGRDETLWTSNPPAAAAPAPAAGGSSDVGRTVLFFLDDWHLSADSLMRSRAALLNLIDTAVGVSDRAGIFAASGSPGFLQQISDNKAVLRAAAEKLNFFNHPIQDKEEPVMSESQALQIEQNNQEVIDYFIDAISEEECWQGRASAEQPSRKSSGDGRQSSRRNLPRSPRGRSLRSAGCCASSRHCLAARCSSFCRTASFSRRNVRKSSAGSAR